MKPVMTEAINATLNDRERGNKEKTIVISSATEGQVKSLLKRAGLVQKVAAPPPLVINGCLPFDWENAMEVQRTTEACLHLGGLLRRAIPNFDTDFQLLDTHASRSVLNFEDSKIGKISGGADLVITPHGTDVDSLHDEICVLFELKTSSQMNPKFQNSATVELISASFLSEQPAILCLLTDLNSVTEAWRTYYDPSLDQNVVDRYHKLTIDQTISLIAFHLTQVVRNPVFVAQPSSNDPNAQRSLCQKRKLDTSGLQEALDRFEDMAEGTADWSRDRAIATWDFLQNMGVEQMPAVVKYSMMYT